MTKTAEAVEVARHLPEFLDEVSAGNEVLITRGQQPVARLVPMNHRSQCGRRSLRNLPPLAGQWIGEAVLKSGNVADEMFSGQ